ncbi:tRNA (adenosine(37)-N6)-threonylcarbamoyltransferase complex dimerization subunit type 1 TsaB [Jannaschia donghaensis]|uniref:UGMP family protein n=1 Tax=Jannaschia donghaensis TaxID=420998 RepID=A0A0M6YG92_9RHOB|nr:tRNA (adenosine(37)-N6)-threonylcarbamoyltransferase complex dimerization subunit type 1 TsaB [Jannaschia donghaensis]CTQ48970.1 UGMP family protein [Jannaschia donghaensis]
MSDRLTLAFDTSAAHCAAALLSGDRVLATAFESMRKGQAERLMPLLEDVLAKAGHAWSDLDVIGVGTGPGNFTGVRIAVAGARGLGLGLGIPVEGVTAPEAYAAGRDVIVCLDAPRDRVHFAYGSEILLGDVVPPNWHAPLTGPAAARIAEASGRPLAETPDLAVEIARIAADRAAPGRARPAPVYMRPADAAPASDPPPVILP